MALGIISGLIIIALLAGSIVWCFKGKATGSKWLPTVAVIVLSLAFIVVPFSWHTIEAGQVAVVKQLGKAKTVRTAGTYFDFWLMNSYQKYDAKVQDIRVETAAYSSDAQTMTLQVTVQYKILSDKVMDIANEYGDLDALNTRIISVVTEKTKSVLSAHTAMDIIAKRSAMSPAVEEAVKKVVGENYYVDVETIVLTNIDFSDAFESAVEEKMIAEQKQLKASYENETKVAAAKAEAEAKLIEAEADKKANELLNQSLSNDILQKLWIEKWNGTMPTYYGGDADLMFNVGE